MKNINHCLDLQFLSFTYLFIFEVNFQLQMIIKWIQDTNNNQQSKRISFNTVLVRRRAIYALRYITFCIVERISAPQARYRYICFNRNTTPSYLTYVCFLTELSISIVHETMEIRATWLQLHHIICCFVTLID